ncbi:MAG: type I DNA topoisomerase [Candidatus Marinimicrobia bacterium]|jgi:DNA topoisomerase-1|nr:type I DNA topoisomerase [Candidatus Neomarinimicrobiota bacterium]MBT3500719.1 type I DNA topoisomerase [Candidatus Neomarinimicrobiota bacterium]MBT3839567.1 type I DNA topoisomerase [Candidatus Neomarinimicrobiota bacterium]MBT3998903.1 type I DNA topoisomerase [Candidatus Neomarinimicrobiota bacterium]MBT4579141.1 type I DNA topoisomerase [Candidatus Neomarinimicrobiota bacterium]
MSQKPLLIVESPTKIKTIQKYLGDEYEVISCVGHVKDLPSKELGIDIENDFEIKLTPLPDKKKFLTDLRRKSKLADRVLIATDPDREGEAIAAHLASEVPKEKLQRVQFTEITKAGVAEGMSQVREIDQHLVDAQTARRVIDRLVGYKVSPVLWATLQSNMKFVTTTLSAGRVQSAAVKLIVDKDRLRAKFNQSSYYDLKAVLNKTSDSNSFNATLIRVDGAKIASSNDFDSTTGNLKNKDVLLLSESQADALVKELDSGDWIVTKIEEKPRTSKPKPPFTTSTLQQEAARKLRSSARQTMSTAQQLYENGFITYMRTDSTNLSEEAIAGARQVIQNLYGDDYLPGKAIRYATKVKNAQEAHEAIRPANRTFLSVSEVESKIGKDAAKLYDLIWKRTVASQMTPAKLKQTAVTIVNQKTEFRANGQVIFFPGYMRVYVEGQDNPDKDLANKERILPEMSNGESLNCSELKSESHTTKPPARYTEASLVKALEENGIGRPSTFASIMGTIVRRAYVDRSGGKLSPTFLGLSVTQLLENHYTNLVSKEFTAKMENGLDEISRGEQDALSFMTNFYRGGGQFTGLEKMLDEKVDIPAACTIEMPESISESTEGRIGKFGPYLRRGEDTRSIPDKIYFGDLTLETIEEIFNEEVKEDEPLGNDPKSGESIWIKKGPYGHYVQLGDTKTRKGIPKTYTLSDVDLDYALKLLALPRTVGNHPETGEAITADYGRYGAYIRCGKQNASLRGPETPLDISVNKSVELLANRNKKSAELRTIGDHPETGESLLVKDGRFGPYITDGKVNVSLKGDLTPESVTLEQAVELINQKRLAPARPKRKRKKKKK